MRIADIKYNDTVDCESGICVSFWVQGCPFHCEGCHNQEQWDPNGGAALPIEEVISRISDGVTAHGIFRNFSVLGGEPLAEYNRANVSIIVNAIRKKFPSIKIYLWTGYTKEELELLNNKNINEILSNIDVLIEGRYKQEERDITLPLRGSRNQRVLYKGEF